MHRHTADDVSALAQADAMYMEKQCYFIRQLKKVYLSITNTKH